jgi:hydroxymethylpyrimidine pyrophosphatase-like HAD family hydrolase
MLGLFDKFKFIKKERSIGFVPINENENIRYEPCDEIAISLQNEIKANFEFSSFHSYNQIWCDIGSKTQGILSLQNLLETSYEETLHIGDQFREIGNDISARKVSSTLWIVSPLETHFFLTMLLNDLKNSKRK